LYAIELAITLNKNSENYSEKFDIVALPFIPRKGEKSYGMGNCIGFQTLCMVLKQVKKSTDS